MSISHCPKYIVLTEDYVIFYTNNDEVAIKAAYSYMVWNLHSLGEVLDPLDGSPPRDIQEITMKELE